MIKLNSLEIVSGKIEILKGKLNYAILIGDDEEFILKLSRELDKLINLYYKKLEYENLSR